MTTNIRKPGGNQTKHQQWRVHPIIYRKVKAICSGITENNTSEIESR